MEMTLPELIMALIGLVPTWYWWGILGYTFFNGLLGDERGWVAQFVSIIFWPIGAAYSVGSIVSGVFSALIDR